MGAWALRLFCCDWDLDFVQELDRQCGLLALEVAAGREPRHEGSLPGTARQEEHRRIKAKSDKSGKAVAINYSMFEKLCSDPPKVRAHLDDTKILDRIFADRKREAANIQPHFLRDPYGPGYRMCLMGACAMSLGARVSPNDRAAMKTYCRTCGLMRDAVTQIEQALHPDTGYVDGCAWNFENDITAAAFPTREDELFPGLGMMNVWSPDHGRPPMAKGEGSSFSNTILHTIGVFKPNVDDLAQSLASLTFNPYDSAKTTISSTKADADPEKWRAEAQRLVNLYNFHTRSETTQEDSGQTCGSCGAGGKLSKCGKCQEVHYCNKSCQKKDFPKHKVICPLAARLKLKSEQSLEKDWLELIKGVKQRGG